MSKNVFSEDLKTDKELVITPGAPIADVVRTITSNVDEEIIKKGDCFAQEITDKFVADFKKPGDQMVHVSTFVVIDNAIYVSYYANEKNPNENPEFQTARLVYAPVDDVENKTYLDLQTIGDEVDGKKMYSDIGIMQKLSSREEDGEIYYYSGTYSGDFTCVIKSKDLITWEYVSQPDFINDSKWENATYVLGDKVYYFVRQQDNNKCGFLTCYDLKMKKWEPPVEIYDCQSRSDFIVYNGELYLFHAPIDREHIGVVKIDTKDLSKSEIVLQAKMHTSCFYPYMQYYKNGELAMSYTVSRQHIRLAQFTLSKYL